MNEANRKGRGLWCRIAQHLFFFFYDNLALGLKTDEHRSFQPSRKSAVRSLRTSKRSSYEALGRIFPTRSASHYLCRGMCLLESSIHVNFQKFFDQVSNRQSCSGVIVNNADGTKSCVTVIGYSSTGAPIYQVFKSNIPISTLYNSNSRSEKLKQSQYSGGATFSRGLFGVRARFRITNLAVEETSLGISRNELARA